MLMKENVRWTRSSGQTTSTGLGASASAISSEMSGASAIIRRGGTANNERPRMLACPNSRLRTEIPHGAGTGTAIGERAYDRRVGRGKSASCPTPDARSDFLASQRQEQPRSLQASGADQGWGVGNV